MCIQLVSGHHVSLNSTSTLSGIDLYRDKIANGKQLNIQNKVIYAQKEVKTILAEKKERSMQNHLKGDRCSSKRTL